jgi:hypothetical protein
METRPLRESCYAIQVLHLNGKGKSDHSHAELVSCKRGEPEKGPVSSYHMYIDIAIYIRWNRIVNPKMS